jgi:hypothetical protein
VGNGAIVAWRASRRLPAIQASASVHVVSVSAPGVRLRRFVPDSPLEEEDSNSRSPASGYTLSDR